MTYSDDALNAAIAAEIRRERAALDLLQQQVWEKAGLSKSAYLKIENGQPGTKRTLAQIRSIASALDMTLGELISRAEARASAEPQVREVKPTAKVRVRPTKKTLDQQ